MKVSSKLFMVAVLLISMLAPSALAAEFGVFDDEILSKQAQLEYNDFAETPVHWAAPLMEDQVKQIYSLTLDGEGLGFRGLWRDYIYSLSGMEYMTGLQSLYLTDQQFTDITPITQLEHLQWVDLSNGLVSEVPYLRHMTCLTTLNLSWNAISSLDIHSIPDSLWELDLSNNHINDLCEYNFTRLLPVNSQLQLLDLRNNPLSSEGYADIYQLQAENPDLEILFDAPVPEPAAMSLMLAGGLLLKRRRR